MSLLAAPLQALRFVCKISGQKQKCSSCIFIISSTVTSGSPFMVIISSRPTVTSAEGFVCKIGGQWYKCSSFIVIINSTVTSAGDSRRKNVRSEAEMFIIHFLILAAPLQALRALYVRSTVRSRKCSSFIVIISSTVTSAEDFVCKISGQWYKCSSFIVIICSTFTSAEGISKYLASVVEMFIIHGYHDIISSRRTVTSAEGISKYLASVVEMFIIHGYHDIISSRPTVTSAEDFVCKFSGQW